MKFDKVIMNPPYHIGGKIWDVARKVSENIVCLMPLAQYKKNGRYKYIGNFKIIDNSLFDAIIMVWKNGNQCIMKNRSSLAKSEAVAETLPKPLLLASTLFIMWIICITFIAL